MTNEDDLEALIKAAPPPAMVSLTVTSRCNLRCVMCHHSQSRIKKQDIGDEVIAKLASHMRSASAIDLTGLGEAWLSPQFRPILNLFPVEASAQDRDFKISFNCNGTRFDDADISLLLSSGVRKIRISIDSANAERFEALRGVALDHVLGQAGRLIAAKQARGGLYPLIGVQMTLMKSNRHELRAMVDLCTDLGADFLDIWSLNELETEVAKTWTVGAFNYEAEKVSNVPGEELEALTENVHAYAAECGLSLFTALLGKTRWSEGYPGEDWGNYDPVRWKPQSLRCPLPWQVQRSHYDGEVHSCCWGTKPIADLREVSAEDAWNGPAIQAMRRDLIEGRIPEPCSGAGCPYVLGKTRGEQRAEEIRRLTPIELNLFNELLTQEIMRQHVRPGDVVIDAGANDGAHVQLLSQLVTPDGRVHAFEPNPDLLARLSGIAPNVRVWSLALGAEFGVRDFHIPELDTEQASLDAEAARRGGHAITTRSVIEARLDDLSEAVQSHVAFVKIDVEGHELQALSGMRDMLARDQPVVVYENNTEAINQFWSSLGYTVYFPAADQRVATPNVVAIPPFEGVLPHDMLVADTAVDHVLSEVKRRLARGGDKLIDRISSVDI